MGKQINDINILVIPDIHGRIFWKSALEQFPKEHFPNLDIVFLGDYVDPYSHENISREQAIDNFKEILEVANIDNRIHLLIGNHDMHYFYNAQFKSRCDFKNYDLIKSMFEKNMDLFNIAFEKNINNEKYLFTHAGVSKPWLNHIKFIGDIAIKSHSNKLSKEQLEYCEMLKNFTPDANKLNLLKDNFQGQALLWMASYARGGDYNVGSCIWEDLSEWGFEGMEIPGMWQIFGHSRWSKKDPDNAYIDYDRKFACVDTCSVWAINNEGKLKKIENL